MERLTSRDLQEALALLSEIYRLSNMEQFLEHLLGRVSGLVAADLVGYADVDMMRGTSTNRFNPAGVNTPETDRAWEAYMLQHPVLAYFLETRDGSPRKISDFSTLQQFHRTDFYNEAYRRMSVEDVYLTFMPAQRERVVTLAIHRSRRSFTERDRLMLGLLRPHLMQAWQNTNSLTKIHQEMKLLRRTLDQLHRGVIVLDSMGRVSMMTARASRLLVECFGKPEESGHLPERLRTWVRHQLSLVDTVDSLQPRVPLLIECEGTRVEFRLVSDSGRNLLLVEEQRNSADPVSLLPLGLTPREAEVLVWVMEGKTNTEIATILAVSPRTVQKHMEHIMVKLGVETRTAAARIATSTVQPSRGQSS